MTVPPHEDALARDWALIARQVGLEFGDLEVSQGPAGRLYRAFDAAVRQRDTLAEALAGVATARWDDGTFCFCPPPVTYQFSRHSAKCDSARAALGRP